jgi:type II secretory pathway pseudopilin PulG
MRSLEISAGQRRRRASGFSLIEMTMVVALTIVVSVMSVLSLTPVVNGQRMTNAYNYTVAALRQGRDNAVSQRTSYSVTFSNTVTPNTITIAWAPPSGVTQLPNGQVPATVVYQLPVGVTYAVPPTNTSPAPDNFGSGAYAMDFGYTSNGDAGGTTAYTVYFCPDGSAQVANTCLGAGLWDSGVIYLARTVDTSSYKAVSLWGATGRIHGWRIYSRAGGFSWLRQ